MARLASLYSLGTTLMASSEALMVQGSIMKLRDIAPARRLVFNLR